MAVYIYEGHALIRLGIVEGSDWVTLQKQNPASPYSFYAFQVAWDTQKDYLGEADNVLPDGGSGTLYGRDGYSRYVVRHDGEIVLLGSSTREEVRDRAQKAGIRVG